MGAAQTQAQVPPSKGNVPKPTPGHRNLNFSRKDDVVDMLRKLGLPFREHQRTDILRAIVRECQTDTEQRELLRQVAFRGNLRVDAFQEIFRAGSATCSLAMKAVIVELVLCLVTAEGTIPADLDRLVRSGVSQLTLDVFASATASPGQPPVLLIERTAELVDRLMPLPAFAGEFVRRGGSKILFGQLVAKYPSDVPRQKAMKVLRHLAQHPEYLKHMSESGGISALVQGLQNTENRAFVQVSILRQVQCCRDPTDRLVQWPAPESWGAFRDGQKWPKVALGFQATRGTKTRCITHVNMHYLGSSKYIWHHN